MKTLEIYRREGTMWVVRANHADDDVAPLEPFDTIPFDVGSLWRVPGSKP